MCIGPDDIILFKKVDGSARQSNLGSATFFKWHTFIEQFQSSFRAVLEQFQSSLKKISEQFQSSFRAV